MLELLAEYPYIGVIGIFLACGLGLPLPEEIVLISAGYVCFKGLADPYTMAGVSALSILAGDVIPFVLGRVFGSGLLKLRPMRLLVNPERLARFDKWFSRRGDYVIFASRFIAGIRVVSFFTAGVMKTSWTRFLILDSLGIVLIVPLMVWIGFRFGGTIDEAIRLVRDVERGILWSVLGGGTVVLGWYWLRRRRRQRLLVGEATETFVGPSTGTVVASTEAPEPVDSADPDAESTPAADDAATAPQPPATPAPSAPVEDADAPGRERLGEPSPEPRDTRVNGRED